MRTAMHEMRRAAAARAARRIASFALVAAVAPLAAAQPMAFSAVSHRSPGTSITRTIGLATGRVAHASTPYGAGAAFCNPWGGLSISGKSINDVYPCANPNTSDRWGTEQCADFTNRYEYATFGLVAAVDGGKIVRTLHSDDGVPIGSPGPGSVPAAGDAVSMWGDDGQDAPGHTGVVDSVSVNSSGNGSILYLDQNGSLRDGDSIGYDLIYVHNWVFSTGWNAPYNYNLFDWTEQAGGVFPDGSFIDYEGNVFRIVGGAPLYVSSWSVFGGAKPVKNVTTAQFDLLGTYPANGTPVDLASGPLKGAGFVFAGGAPLPVTSWKNVGVTSASQLTGIDPADLANVGKGGVWAHVAAYPANGTPVFVDNPGTGHGAGYYFAGGAPLPVASWTNVGVTKGSQLTGVDVYALDNPGPSDHVRQYPANGTDVFDSSGPSKGAGFVFAGGAPLAVAKWANVGVTSTSQLTGVDPIALTNYAATGAYSHVRRFPANGTAVYVGTPGSQHNDGFVFAGGAPMYVSAWANVDDPLYTEIDAAAIDSHTTSGSYSHTLATPANGTFLVTKAGADYRVAGGYAFTIADCTYLGGCAAAALVDPWAITHTNVAGRSYLSASPANGTEVRGEPSGDYWVFENDERATASASSSAVEVDDTSLSSFTIS
jgi:hypothetical protein